MTNPSHYRWSDDLGREVRRAGTHSGAKELQRKELLKRKEAIDKGEDVEWTTQNSFYYYLRMIFLSRGIDPAKEGKNFRKSITNQIDDICKEFRTTREDLRIIADTRATLYFRNEKYHVSLKNIEEKDLDVMGTDVIIIEKAALCELLAPLAAKVGIALLDTKGYVVEYAKKLSYRAQEYEGHIAMITDFDTDGLLMAFDVYRNVSRDIYRIGIDFDTIEELREMYPELNEGLDIEKLQESYKPGTSIKRLEQLSHYGHLISYSLHQEKSYQDYLQFVRQSRIEIDSVQRAIGATKLWAFIVKKLEERFPERNYNRAIRIKEMFFPDIYLNFQKLLLDRIKPERNIIATEMSLSFDEYQGIMDDINDDERAIRRYFTMEINNSSSLKDIVEKIKGLVDELRQQNIKSFMESI